MTLITLKNVVKRYVLDGVQSTVLNNISFSVNAGELISVVGSSGSGKSTLMNLMGLLDKPCEGEYWFQGRTTSELTSDELAELRNKAIGFVFQQFNLLPRLTALQNVALPLTYRKGISSAEANQQALHALTRVNMNAYGHHRPTQLSGGQQQRVAIARALVGDPQIILADEPTGALDSETSHEIMNLFLQLNREGRTFVVITHDEQVANLAGRKITLSDGHIILDRKR